MANEFCPSSFNASSASPSHPHTIAIMICCSKED
jgi:hypothetical protein